MIQKLFLCDLNKKLDEQAEQNRFSTTHKNRFLTFFGISGRKFLPGDGNVTQKTTADYTDYAVAYTYFSTAQYPWV